MDLTLLFVDNERFINDSHHEFGKMVGERGVPERKL